LQPACKECNRTKSKEYYRNNLEKHKKEFDHQKDKFRNISELLRTHSWEKILEEIKKCEIRCANCHRRKTHKEQKTYRYQYLGFKH
jgi:5-methylcytosine-specific restriction endonuclease McrA